MLCLSKICSKCGIEKPKDDFWKDKYILDGLYSSCKECSYRYKRKLPKKSIARAGYKFCCQCKKEMLVQNFQNCKSMKDGLQPRCKDCHAKATRNWQLKYPEKNRNKAERYRALKFSAETYLVTNEFILQLYNISYCYYCDNFIEPNLREIEHKTPLSRGGLHHPDNLVMSCKSCNRKKHNKTEEEFKEIIRTTNAI